jgi:hypothetical protein
VALPVSEGISADAQQDELLQKGLSIYEQRLRSRLEPEHDGQVVAIHVDSGDYEVGRSSGDAMRAMRQRRPVGKLLLHTIGVVSDSALAAQMCGQRPIPAR